MKLDTVILNQIPIFKEEETDEDLKEMSKEEEEDTKYLSIFENEYNDFDEKVMSLESFDELKKWKWL